MSIRRILNGLRVSPLLDLYPIGSNLGAAWSLRKLNNNYNGKCFKVRRSSDNAMTDIGFSGNMLDLSALLTFIGSGNGFINIWYDQSGNEQNLIQNDTARQPQIVQAGSIILENEKPAIYFDGTNDYLEVASSNAYFRALHSDKALVTVVTRVGYSPDPNIACGFIDTGGGLNTNIGYTLFYDDRAQFNRNNAISNIAANSVSSPVSHTPHNIFVTQEQNILTNNLNINSVIPNNRSTIEVNNDPPLKNNTSTTTPNISSSTRTLKVGAVHTLNLINFHFGTMQEIVIYLNDQSAQKNFIRSNINSYYNIY